MSRLSKTVLFFSCLLLVVTPGRSAAEASISGQKDPKKAKSNPPPKKPKKADGDEGEKKDEPIRC